MRLDYNPDDKPLRLLLPKEFVEEALQVIVTWDHDLTDDGFQVRFEAFEHPAACISPHPPPLATQSHLGVSPPRLATLFRPSFCPLTLPRIAPGDSHPHGPGD